LKEYPFEWYEFKIGDKRAGELLAAFELIEINPVNSFITILYSMMSTFSLLSNRKHEKLKQHVNLNQFQ
jgi:hypothetical protein